MPMLHHQNSYPEPAMIRRLGPVLSVFGAIATGALCGALIAWLLTR